MLLLLGGGQNMFVFVCAKCLSNKLTIYSIVEFVLFLQTELTKQEVKIFQQNSRGENMMINIKTKNSVNFFFFFFISYFTWVFIQVLSPVLPWSPGPECTEQFDCRDGFSLLICSERHISNGR